MKQPLDEWLTLLASVLVKVDDVQDMKGTLLDLLTPQEIVALWERIQILKHLRDGMTQRKVAEKMWISVTTVNRGARVLKFGTGAAEKYILED